MIVSVPHHDSTKRDWKVAANPIKFSLKPAPKAITPPKIGEHNEKYLSNSLNLYFYDKFGKINPNDRKHYNRYILYSKNKLLFQKKK